MAEKQALLVDAIANGVQAKVAVDIKEAKNALAAENKALAVHLAQLQVVLHSILARMATLEAATEAASVAPKRATRAATAGGAAKKPAAKAGGAKKPTAATGNVTNALLFFRKAMAEDINGIRGEYATQENLDEADTDNTVAKVSKDDEGKYYSAVGAYLWKTVLSEEQKAEMRAQFTAWKEDQQREQNEEPLDEE